MTYRKTFSEVGKNIFKKRIEKFLLHFELIRKKKRKKNIDKKKYKLVFIF